MYKNFWCGNFELINLTNEKVIFIENLINTFISDSKNESVTCLKNEDDYILKANNKVFNINLNTLLFFHDYNKYWEIYKNLDLVDVSLILEDFLSKETYLDFSNLNEKKDFYKDLSIKIQNNLMEDKSKIDIKKFLLSFNIKEMFNNINKFSIPENDKINFLKNLSDIKVIENNWSAFKIIFEDISNEKKNVFFEENSFLNYINPIIKSAYSYEYKNNDIIYINKSTKTLTRNNFEKFLLKNNQVFHYFLNNEKKLFFMLITKSQRKEVVRLMLDLNLIKRDLFSNEEMILLNKYTNQMEINLNKELLYQELQNKLQNKEKVKKLKI